MSPCVWLQVRIDEVKISPKTLAETIALIADGTISSKIAKELASDLLEGVAEGSGVAALVEERGMGQISDEASITAMIQQVIAANPKQAEQYRCAPNPKHAHSPRTLSRYCFVFVRFVWQAL